MSMMVNPVSMSNVRFTANEGTNVLERQGAFAKPATGAPADSVDIQPKKSKIKSTKKTERKRKSFRSINTLFVRLCQKKACPKVISQFLP